MTTTVTIDLTKYSEKNTTPSVSLIYNINTTFYNTAFGINIYILYLNITDFDEVFNTGVIVTSQIDVSYEGSGTSRYPYVYYNGNNDFSIDNSYSSTDVTDTNVQYCNNCIWCYIKYDTSITTTDVHWHNDITIPHFTDDALKI